MTLEWWLIRVIRIRAMTLAAVFRPQVNPPCQPCVL